VVFFHVPSDRLFFQIDADFFAMRNDTSLGTEPVLSCLPIRRYTYRKIWEIDKSQDWEFSRIS
jgi:hypothetical protein